MLIFKKLSRKPTHFLRYTGLTVDQFVPLVAQLNPMVEEARRERLSRPDRKRTLGAGGHYSLALEDRLLMSLCYHRLYLTQSLLGYLFNLDERNVCRNLKELDASLLAVLPPPERLLQRVLETAKRIGTLEEFAEKFPDLKAIVDATEQPVRRPQEKKKRDAHYSGRRKRTTKKRQVTVTSSGIILDPSPHVPGSVHDFTLFKEPYDRSPPLAELLRRTVGYMDSGYQGIEDFLPSCSVGRPSCSVGRPSCSVGRPSCSVGRPSECQVRPIQRARRNRPLTKEQKKLNSLRSATRIRVEHALSRIKKFRIAEDVYRGKESFYDARMNVVAGLVNLRRLDALGILL